jgi:hypothetical protein
MEIVLGWRVVRVVTTPTGGQRQENLSRVFGSRDTALTCARCWGAGAFIKAVTAYANDAKGHLC